jgi:hypothetical protein
VADERALDSKFLPSKVDVITVLHLNVGLASARTDWQEGNFFFSRPLPVMWSA